MPEIRHFLVTQTRQVEVTANNVIDAQQIAEEHFASTNDVNGTKLEDRPKPTYGSVTKKVRDEAITVQRLR